MEKPLTDFKEEANRALRHDEEVSTARQRIFAEFENLKDHVEVLDKVVMVSPTVVAGGHVAHDRREISARANLKRRSSAGTG